MGYNKIIRSIFPVKLFKIEKRNDYGTEIYLKILTSKKYSVFQCSISLCDFSSFLYVQIMLGNGKLFGFFCYFWKLGFDLDLFGRTWRI